MTVGSSFTSRVKRELAAIPVADPPAALAELAGLVRSGGRLHLGGAGPQVELASGEAAVARRAVRLLKEALGIRPRVLVRLHRQLRRGNVYAVRVENPAEARRLLEAVGVWRADGGAARGLPRPLRRAAARDAFLRGCFMGGGHVHPPERGYHLEWLVFDPRTAHDLRRLLARMGWVAGVAARREGYAVYLKEGDAIAALLGRMGAHGAVLAFEQVRVLRDLRGRLNRMVNAETANLGKAAAAAAEQRADIRALAEAGLLERLPPPLRQLARARLEHPELSLRELGALLDPPAGKSTVAHRMRRLRELARALRAGEEPRLRRGVPAPEAASAPSGRGGAGPGRRRRKGMASQAPE